MPVVLDRQGFFLKTYKGVKIHKKKKKKNFKVYCL